jgi:hypothetical protein
LKVNLYNILTFESETGTDLVAGLVEFLGIERSTDTESESGVDLGVVSDGNYTTIVDLELGKGGWINSVLGGNLDTNGRLALGVVSSLDTGLNRWVDLVVIRSSEDAQAVGGSNSQAVNWSLITESSSILGQSSLLDIETGFTTNEETLMGEDTINGSVNIVVGWVELSESAGVESTLLEVEVTLLGLEAGLRSDLTNVFGLYASGKDIVKLELGGEDVVVGPGTGGGDTLLDDLLSFNPQTVSIDKY